MAYQTPTPSFQPLGTEPPGPSPGPAPAPDMPQHYDYQPQPQSQQPPLQQFSPQPQPQQSVTPSPFVGTDLRTMKSACEISLREYATLQQQGAAGDRRHNSTQGSLAVSDLLALRSEVTAVLRRAEAHRWRRWLIGGAVAAIIPGVRRIFRRSSSSDDHQVSSNDTEHAFRRSKSLIAHILDSVRVHGKSGLASVAFFVLAVLYVFQNEVSLRVARTVSKRLKRLVAKVEDGVEPLDERDFKVLNGWRWRVLLW
ncbi:hypothetical protein F4777DRAFT_560757 [Nemania sp. FL0916]|nr:hypothetical protein F4777DRAFT_560757 [Nemania sp. FL0916]